MSDSEELARLADLHQRGMLSSEEFARAKARVFNGSASTPAADAINSLRRSRSDRWLGGVCGGIARVTGLPSWLWRLLFALLMLLAGSGLLAYLLMWIFIPLDPLPAEGLQRACPRLPSAGGWPAGRCRLRAVRREPSVLTGSGRRGRRSRHSIRAESGACASAPARWTGA